MVGIERTALSTCRMYPDCDLRLLVVAISNSVCKSRMISFLKKIGVGEFGYSVGMIVDPNQSSDVRVEQVSSFRRA